MAVNEFSAFAGQYFHRDNPVPSWFIRFVNSNILFTGIPTIAVVSLLVAVRFISRRTADTAAPRSWADFDFGLPLVISALVAIPAATTLRVERRALRHQRHGQ